MSQPCNQTRLYVRGASDRSPGGRHVYRQTPNPLPQSYQRHNLCIPERVRGPKKRRFVVHSRSLSASARTTEAGSANPDPALSTPFDCTFNTRYEINDGQVGRGVGRDNLTHFGRVAQGADLRWVTLDHSGLPSIKQL